MLNTYPRARASFLFLTAAIILTSCAHMPEIEEYSPRSASATPNADASLKVAVALSDNRAPSPSTSEEDVRLAEVRLQHKRLLSKGPKTHATHNICTFRNSALSPEKFTELVIKELRASGAFASVDHEGAGPADVVVKPTITWCSWTVLGLNLHNVLDFNFDIALARGGETLPTKSYEMRHEKWSGNWTQIYTQLLPPVMSQARGDIVDALAK